MASAIFAPTWRSVRPGLSQPGTLACTRSIAAPAARSAPTSAADLRIRSGERTVLARRCSASGKRLLNASTCSAHIRSDTATERGSPTALAIIPNGSSVSPQVTNFQAEVAGRRGLRRHQLKPGHEEERVTVRGDGQAGQPL